MFGIFNKTNLSSFERFFVFDASFSHLYPDLIELSTKPFCLLYSHQKIWQTLTQAMARCQNVPKIDSIQLIWAYLCFNTVHKWHKIVVSAYKEAPLLASWPPGGVGVPLLECSLVALGFAKIAWRPSTLWDTVHMVHEASTFEDEDLFSQILKSLHFLHTTCVSFFGHRHALKGWHGCRLLLLLLGRSCKDVTISVSRVLAPGAVAFLCPGWGFETSAHRAVCSVSRGGNVNRFISAIFFWFAFVWNISLSDIKWLNASLSVQRNVKVYCIEVHQTGS